MHLIWGLLMVVIGLPMFAGGTTRSEFVLYRLLTERSKKLWGKHVHRFYQFSGVAIITVGILIACKIIGI